MTVIALSVSKFGIHIGIRALEAQGLCHARMTITSGTSSSIETNRNFTVRESNLRLNSSITT